MQTRISTCTRDNRLPSGWPVICISNLLLAAVFGLMMRYKIVFPFPALDQGFALQAHFHFVFSGWVSLTLFSCVVSNILRDDVLVLFKGSFRFAFWGLELTSLGSLISFLMQGYGFFSIGFEVLSMLSCLFFIIQIWRNLSHQATSPFILLFLKAAMIWYLLSLPGTFFLIYLNLSGMGTPVIIRAAMYFYLHFQYNGWFTFCIFSLLLNWLRSNGIVLAGQWIGLVFWLLTVGLVTGYFLSVLGFYPYLWAEIPSVISVVAHFVAAIILFLLVVRFYPVIRSRITGVASVLWKIATLSFFLKVVLQAATLVPTLAEFAFSFRPLIIGYLHLTFLCFVSFFLIGYLLIYGGLRATKLKVSGMGLVLFIVCVLLSEIGLFAQSAFAFFAVYPPFFNGFMFWITAGIFSGLILFILSQIRYAIVRRSQRS